MSKSRDYQKKAIRIICIARHAATCKVMENCNGHHCNNPQCHKNGDQYELVEDHIDNNRNNNDPDNFQLLCRSCNQKKSPKHLRDSGRMGVREINRPVGMIDEDARQDAMLNNPQMSISQDYKEAYRFWLNKNWKRPGGMTIQQAIYEAAKELDISPVTTRRYLQVETSEAGIFYKIKSTARDLDGTLKRVTFIRMREEFATENSVKVEPSVHVAPRETPPQKPVAEAPMPVTARRAPLDLDRPSYIQ